MARVRAGIRLLSFSAFTLGIYLLYISGLAAAQLAGKDTARWRNLMVGFWARGTARIIGIQIHLEGSPPEAPFFLVSNHLSYIDIVPYFITTHCVFIAKSEIRKWPFLGKMAEDFNIIFIDRNNRRDLQRVNRLISSRISDRQGVVLFPEGTSTKGDKVKKFKSPLLKYAAEQNFPVSYASITYSTHSKEQPAHESICWWGDMTFLDHFFNLLKLKSFEARISFGKKKIRNGNRKILADTLHQLVEQQFIPIVN